MKERWKLQTGDKSWDGTDSTIKRHDGPCTHLDMCGDSAIIDSPIVRNLSYCSICGETWQRLSHNGV